MQNKVADNQVIGRDAEKSIHELTKVQEKLVQVQADLDLYKAAEAKKLSETSAKLSSSRD